MTTYENVSLTPTASVYFDGRAVSHAFTLADGTRKSAGVIFPGPVLTFGTAAPETMELSSGRCRVRPAGAEDWTEYAGGQSFEVPGDSSFEIDVLELVDYVCHYH